MYQMIYSSQSPGEESQRVFVGIREIRAAVEGWVNSLSNTRGPQVCPSVGIEITQYIHHYISFSNIFAWLRIETMPGETSISCGWDS
jgi:hypothetical protein